VYEDMERPEVLPNGEIIKVALHQGYADVFPRFCPVISDKAAMTFPFDEKNTDLSQPLRKELQSYLPFSWVCEPNNPPIENRLKMGWGEKIMSEECWKQGFVIKSRKSFGSKNVWVSTEMSLPKWRECVLKALVTPGFIIQRKVNPKLFWAEIWDDNNI
jgi:hypothetical protein